MNKKLGVKLRKLRELKGYSQEYMASQLGTSQRAYSKLETNHTKISWDKISEIAKTLEIEPIDLLNFDDNLVFNNTQEPDEFELIENNFPERLIEQFEKRINGLENEVLFLKKIIEHNNNFK
jgi:transcriptional regulator with XRE-family HTH domain